MKKDYITPEIHPLYLVMNKMVCNSPGSPSDAQSNKDDPEEIPVGESKSSFGWSVDENE